MGCKSRMRSIDLETYAVQFYDQNSCENVFFIPPPNRVPHLSVPSKMIDGITVCRISDIRKVQGIAI